MKVVDACVSRLALRPNLSTSRPDSSRALRSMNNQSEQESGGDDDGCSEERLGEDKGQQQSQQVVVRLVSSSTLAGRRGDGATDDTESGRAMPPRPGANATQEPPASSSSPRHQQQKQTSDRTMEATMTTPTATAATMQQFETIRGNSIDVAVQQHNKANNSSSSSSGGSSSGPVHNNSRGGREQPQRPEVTTDTSHSRTSQQQQQQPRNKSSSEPSTSQQQKAATATAAAESSSELAAGFEKRLKQGIWVRKIHHNGKSSLRIVKCVKMTASTTAATATTSNKKLISGSATVKSSKSTRSCSSGGASTRSWAGNSSSMRNKKNNKQQPRTQQQQQQPTASSSSDTTKQQRALVWGKKKNVLIPLEKFVAVCKGKTTERAKRNVACPSNRILSLVTSTSGNEGLSLDMEAPTQRDRDKFARAFGAFLNVPVLDNNSNTAAELHQQAKKKQTTSSSGVPPVKPTITETSATTSSKKDNTAEQAPETTAVAGGFYPPPLPPVTRQVSDPTKNITTNIHRTTSSSAGGGGAAAGMTAITTTNSSHHSSTHHSSTGTRDPSSTSHNTATFSQQSSQGGGPVVSVGAVAVAANSNSNNNNNNNNEFFENNNHNNGATSNSENNDNNNKNNNDSDDVSSITGHHYDQEIVEELHHALQELRAELEESRAEAARAVKVAEQAIQSAERSNSNSATDWQNTVTHKAAEAAAMAQRKCAEALAKQRLAEERLEGERRTASFWRKQAELAEEEAGSLQTRAAAAEVQRAAVEEQLTSLRLQQQLAWRSSQNTNRPALQKEVKETHTHRDAAALDAALERNRRLEHELDSTRRELLFKDNLEPPTSRDGDDDNRADVTSAADLAQIAKLHAEATLVRQQFELLKRVTVHELDQLPEESRNWASQVMQALQASQTEMELLRQRLAFESASRRKLLHDVQDLRGAVRVYCRPRPMEGSGFSTSKSSSSSLFKQQQQQLVSLPSQETVMLHREKLTNDKGSNTNAAVAGPMSFEFDRVFGPESTQHDVYSEIEEVCLGALDGYNVCVMVYGQTGSGKTLTLLGDVVATEESDDTTASTTRVVEIKNRGIQLQAMEQLFTIAQHRSERYKDVFSLTIVEVFNERLVDLMAGTKAGESQGEVVVAENSSKSGRRRSQRSTATEDDTASSGKQTTKLEIRTDIHGETVVQGLISIEVSSFEDVCNIWKECLENRRRRLAEQDINAAQYEASCHVIATLKVVSTNIATGLGCVGKIQFVDLAGADLIPRRSATAEMPPSPERALMAAVGNSSEWRFANRSLDTLSEVAVARSQFTRSVPYRNSTLTHLLRDSLEHDTKVLLIACVSSEPKDIQETATTLRFASRMRRVVIGKATKHMLSPP